MLQLTQGQAADKMVVTLNEKRTLQTGYYLFRFTHILTRGVVSKIYSFAEDNSSYPDRYNDFDINTATLFNNSPTGQWVYEVYEQASSSNTDPTGLTEVERGIMDISPSVPFEFKKYNEPTSYSVYAG
jgi:hypothetical protein